jgi:hypothetical protein
MTIHSNRGKTRSVKKVNPAIYDGLQIPTAPTREVKEKVKVLVLEPKMTNDEIKAREGTYFKESEIDTIIKEDCDIYGYDDQGTKKLLARFRKNIIDKPLIRQGWEAFYNTSAASRNRGAAAGPIAVKGAYWSKRKPTEITGWSARYMQDGKVSKMRVNNNVFSSVLGFFEKTPFMGLPCRMTTYTQRFFKQYKHGIPFIQAIDRVFSKLVPGPYKLQKQRTESKPTYQVADTAFSSITINRNFQTALHQDDGDFKEGFGNLSVIERGFYHGGYTLFPRYKVGFDLRTGDFIAMDVHEWHCNTELYETAEDKQKNKALERIHHEDQSTGTMGTEKPFTRISFVCYLREKLADCDEKVTKRYHKSIGLDMETGPSKKQTTRKKQREE